MRRTLGAVLSAVLALVVVPASPAGAADTWLQRYEGVQLTAQSTLMQVHPDGTYEPGTYVLVEVGAYEQTVYADDGTVTLESVACAFYGAYQFEPTSMGILWGMQGCAPIAGLGSGPDLSSANVAAEVPVTWCYDAEHGEQCEPAGTFALDIRFEATSRLTKDGYGGTWSGEPGVFRYTANNINLWRDGIVLGDLELDGASVLVEGGWTYGNLGRFRGGDRAIWPKGS